MLSRDPVVRPAAPSTEREAGLERMPEPLRNRLEFYGAVRRLGLEVEPANVRVAKRHLWFGPRWHALSPLALFAAFYGLAGVIGWGLLPLALERASAAGSRGVPLVAALFVVATAAVPFVTVLVVGAIGSALVEVRVEGQSFMVTQTGPTVKHPTMPPAVRTRLDRVLAGEVPHVEQIALLEQQVDPILIVSVGGHWYTLGRWT